MVQDDDSCNLALKPMTIRLPLTDYVLLKELADARGISLNTVISEAVATMAGSSSVSRHTETMR